MAQQPETPISPLLLQGEPRKYCGVATVRVNQLNDQTAPRAAHEVDVDVTEKTGRKSGRDVRGPGPENVGPARRCPRKVGLTRSEPTTPRRYWVGPALGL